MQTIAAINNHSFSLIGKKTYLLLGKMFTSRYPNLAEELLQEISVSGPAETDLSKIDKYFTVFCKLKDTRSGDLRGALTDRKKMHLRKLFVSVMLHRYSPSSYHQPTNHIIITYGFNKIISQVLQIDNSYTRRMIISLIAMEKIYDDYRADVDYNLNLFNGSA